MAADPNIYSLIKPPAPPPDPLEGYAKVQNLRALMGQNQLQQLQTQKLTGDLADEDAYRNLFKNAPEGSTLESLLPEAMKVNPVRGLALQKTITDQKKTDAELTGIKMKNAVAATAAHRDELANVNTYEQAVQWTKDAYTNKDLAPITGQSGPLEQKIAAIPTDPAAFQQWKQQNALGATKFIELNKPSIHMQDTGGTSNIVSVPGLGGAPETISTTKKTNSPDALLHDATARRGQNMTDSRSREANGIMADGGITPESEQMAQAIAAGKLPPLSGFALNKPGGRAVMGRVMQINPDYSGQDYGVSLNSEKKFTTGKQGDAVRSFNTSLAHLDTLDQLSDALKNGNMQMINKLGNAYATQTGGTAPTNFAAAKQIVGDEIVKAIVGSGGGVADREHAAKILDAANSPDQLKGVIGTYKELMRGQLKGLRQQYEAGGGKNFDKFLSPAGKSAEGAGPVHIGGDADYAKLPAGSQYIGPDGVLRMKK